MTEAAGTNSAVPGSFTLERTYNAPVAKVYHAFANKTAKEKWFFKGPDSPMGGHSMDFRIGGHESNSGTFHDGVTHRFEGTYYDIVPDARIVYTYEMYLDAHRISVSLATITFEDQGDKTKLVLHEDGIFLDGYDTVHSRERGTRELLESIAATL
jgi:uncharacterized protein YndB with AHSA1/START domain